MKVALFGMYGLYNYGCEAIVRGTYELVKKAWPESQIIYYTHRADEDIKVLQDLDIIVKPVPIRKNLIIWRVINKILTILSIEKQFNHWDSKKIVSECDLVISVGGDLYTIPKFILNTNSERKYSPIVEFGRKVVRSTPMIIWGASIGPFGNQQKIKNYYFNHLKDIKQIFCREEISYNYLVSNGVGSNIQLCSDPAFYINSQSRPYNVQDNVQDEVVNIALNLSPLSIKEQVGENYELFEKDILDTILDILSIENVVITLVPHVISPLSVDDNDLVYIQHIIDSIPMENRNKLKVLENAKGFLGTKDFLKTCDLVIAARMHCAVNAVCEGIPTIFLTYSQKGIGMANHIYRNTYWSVPLLNIKQDLRNKVVEMLNNKSAISGIIIKRIEEIKKEESKIVELFREQM